VGTTTVVKTVTKYDTIREEIISYVPKWKTKIITKTDTIHDSIIVPKEIDTLAILEDYFSTYAYVDTIKKDSVEFIIYDTITQNQIIKRGIKYTILYPTTYITTETFINKRELYGGLGVYGNMNGLTFVGPEFLLKDKKGHAFGLGAGINNKLEPTLGFKMYWKLHK